MAEDVVLAPNPDIVCREEGDDALLFDPVTENVSVLNGTALSLWRLCDGQHSTQDWVEYLAREFPDEDPGALRSDVDAFVADLVSKNLLIQT